MGNIKKLKAKMVETGNSIEMLAEHMGKNKSTVYRKIRNGGKDFSIGEARSIAELLSLSILDINAIFFE